MIIIRVLICLYNAQYNTYEIQCVLVVPACLIPHASPNSL